MKMFVSLLIKSIAGIVLAWSLALMVRTTGRTSGGPPPERGRPRSENPAGEPTQLILPVHGEPLRPGWGRPAPDVIPRPTYWPALFALGVAFFMWGLISNLFVLGLGFTLFIVSCAGWVYDLIGEFKG
jgi:hypothetical protein